MLLLMLIANTKELMDGTSLLSGSSTALAVALAFRRIFSVFVCVTGSRTTRYEASTDHLA